MHNHLQMLLFSFPALDARIYYFSTARLIILKVVKQKKVSRLSSVALSWQFDVELKDHFDALLFVRETIRFLTNAPACDVR